MLQNYYKDTNAVFLAHGYVGNIIGKSINGVLMHSNVFNIVGLIDKDKFGKDTAKILHGVTKTVPIVGTFKDSLRYSPKVLILMENSIRNSIEEIREAINYGLDVINPSFTFISDMPDMSSLSKNKRTRIFDLRKNTAINRIADGSILNIDSKVVYVSGTDCGLGKRTAAYELYLEARKNGINAAFAATGQTGIMIGADGGVVFDSLRAQYTTGVIEKMITDIDKKGFELIFLEGQASIMHYAYSSSVSLLHAGNPHCIVMVHDQKRSIHVEHGDSPIFKMCKLKDEIEITEKLSLPGGNKFKVVAIATIGDDNIETLEQMKKEGELQNLPIADARKKGGPKKMLDAVVKYLEDTYNWKPNN